MKKLITAGVDIGSLTSKVVLLENGSILLWSQSSSSDKTVEEIMKEALEEAGVKTDEVQYIVATGVGKKEASYAKEQATEVLCDTKGALYLCPSARGVIDIGAESCRAIRYDEKGNVVDYTLNDKCASGSGIFLDTMAKALGVSPEEMGELSLHSTQDINITSMCAVFAESEVVSLIHRRVDRVDILKGIHNSIANRICGMVNRVQLEGEITIIGGVANNIGVITSLKDMLEIKLTVPQNPQIVGALGAALIAKEKTGN